MTDFVWNREAMELQIINPSHPTYVPFCGNRCWALIPTDLDWYCYVVNLPNFLRVLKRIGLYIQVGEKRGSITKVLENLQTFYGANYLRLTGEAEKVRFEIKVFPDVEQSILYIVTSAENKAKTNKDIKVLVAADCEFHTTPWACKGFTEDATQDYTGLGRKVNTPRDDKIKAGKDGEIFFVHDAKNPGVGFIASRKPSGWTLDRSKFSFETPMSGYNRLSAGKAGEVLDLSNEETSDDSFCVFRHDLCLQPSRKAVVPVITGYQAGEDTAAILETLKRHEEAFEKTKSFYQIPLVNGVKVETPDPIINAQFNLFTLFMKLNEHYSDSKRGFLPAAHYYSWLCGDSGAVLPVYAYTNDLRPVVDSINLFERFQHADGYVPDLPLWTEGPSWREREAGFGGGGSVFYVVMFCRTLKIMQDKAFAKEKFPFLKKIMELTLANMKEGLMVTGGYFSFDAIDWPGGFAHCPQTFVSVAAFKGLMELRDLALWLGDEEYAGSLLARADELKETINEKLWMEDRGHYRIGLPIGKVGTDERDAELFSREMVAWSTLVAVLWGVADGDRAQKALRTVKERLFTPYGLKFFDPHWSPSYTDVRGACTYEAGRIQNGAYWHCWWSIESLVSAEIMVGKSEEAFKDFLEVRLDTIYSRFRMKEKGKEMSFVRAGEWTDTDLTFPITSIPYTITAAFFNQTLLESILGINVGYGELRIEPHLPSSWNHAKVSNLKIGDSEWSIEIQGNGKVMKMILDEKETSSLSLPLTPGPHHVKLLLSS
jgi:hypothetical protein